jgi:hypothetical protein
VQLVELAAPHAVEQRGAFHQLVAGEREQPPLGRAATAWPERPTRCRKFAIERGEPSWQDEIDIADIDAQLQRRRRHQRPQRAALQPLLGVEALLLGRLH